MEMRDWRWADLGAWLAGHGQTLELLCLIDPLASCRHGVCGIASVDDERRVLHDEIPVVRRVIGRDQDAVLPGEIVGV